MSRGRPIEFYRYERCPDPKTPGKHTSEKRVRNGIFHQWGVDYEELFEGGVGNFSVAIIETEDGKIVTAPADQCRFTDRNDGKL